MTPRVGRRSPPTALQNAAVLTTMAPLPSLLSLEAAPRMSTSRTLAILLFDDVEILDFCGPFEVFSLANCFTDPPAFNVLTVAEKVGPVVTRGGLSLNPHHLLFDGPQPDIFLVPGGQGTRKEMHNTPLIDWIKQVSSKAEMVLSVCTGALLVWMLQVNGFMMDVRQAPREVQEIAFKKGLIPYIPADR
jgi:transcriptional regulator GlxA family with amidase domain